MMNEAYASRSIQVSMSVNHLVELRGTIDRNLNRAAEMSRNLKMKRMPNGGNQRMLLVPVK